MSDEVLIVSRRELFDEVWSDPMTKVAPKYGLSDVGLAKVCKKHQIPRPPVGYWAKLEHGKATSKPELPELDESDLEEIRFFRVGFDAGAEPNGTKAEVPDIVVKEDLRKPHRLIDQARAKLRAEQPNDRGLLHANSKSCLNISVTKKSLSRALRILDALMRYWESVDGTVSACESGARFCRDDDGVSISISEQIRRHEKPNERRYYFKEFTYEATGKLTLSIDGWGDGLRKNWSDGKVQRLESVLGNVALNLEKWVIHVRDRRLDNECESRQKQAAEKIREARKANMARESERIKNLDSCVDAWVRATQIRGYLSALDAKLAANEVTPTDPDHFPKWRQWAQWYADSVCPVTPTPTRPEIDEPIARTNKRIKELDLTSKARRAFEQGQVGNTDELARLTREELKQRCGDRHWNLYSEVTQILEGLGYDVSDRSRW
ncbi:hypothetical protein [Roseiconus lacunae]|uniref:hypothetical protein n=1 Tax=Roseiconus lacunae TaxID=2605694 RepID=UPI0011F13672|nr:hypothetical protein [Roseiconus lacunae]